MSVAAKHRDRVEPVAEKVLEFVPERVKAPFILRCGALLIDYFFAVMFPALTLLIGRLSGQDGIKLLGSELNNAGWLAAIVLGGANLIILPMFTGQSIGKMLTGLRIVGMDGRTPSFRSVVLRQTVGYLLTAASAGIGFVISVFSRRGRTLHDFLTGAVVIRARREISR